MVRYPLSQELERKSYQSHAGTSASRIQPGGVQATEDSRPGAMRFQRKSTARLRRCPAGTDVANLDVRTAILGCLAAQRRDDGDPAVATDFAAARDIILKRSLATASPCGLVLAGRAPDG